MKDQLALLYKLQQTDTQMRADERELAGLDDGGALAEQLAGAEAELQQRRETLTATEAELQDKQLQLGSTEDEHKQKWDQAYGGRVSDPKELAALEQKIGELDRRKDKLEDDIIMLLDEVDVCQADSAAKQTEVDELSGELAGVREHFAQRTTALTAELEQLAEQRTELGGQIDGALLDEYERILRRSGDVAVAVAERNTCSACHTAVAGGLVSELQMSSRLVKCENCRRILVLDKRVN